MIWNQQPTVRHDKYQRVRYDATKAPLQPNGLPAKTNNAKTWSSFQDVCKTLFYYNSEQCNGIRLVFTVLDDFMDIDAAYRLTNEYSNRKCNVYATYQKFDHHTWSQPNTDLENAEFITCHENIFTNSKQQPNKGGYNDR